MLLIHGVFQVRMLEWVTLYFSKKSSWSRKWTLVSCTGKWILYHWPGLHLSFSRTIANSHILSVILHILNHPPTGERSCLHADQKCVDPSCLITRRLLILTPNYLIINQSEECPWADHIPPPPQSPCVTLSFKGFHWKPSGSWVFWPSVACMSCLAHCYTGFTPHYHESVSVDLL